jgi:flagellar basal-body rod protein FlgC
MLDAMKSHNQGLLKEHLMSMFKIFDVAGSAVSAQSQRLNVVASNLANADTVAGPDGKAYKARQVVFQTELMGAGTALGRRRRRAREHHQRGPHPGRRVHDPKHPGADAEGYVTYSNVNAVEEMVNMMSASRSYQNNIEVMNTARSLLLKTLQMGQLMSTSSTPAANPYAALNGSAAATGADAERSRQRRPLPEAAGRADAEPGPAEPAGQRAGHQPDGADQHRQRHRQAEPPCRGLNSQFLQMQALQGASLVGRDVTVAGDRLARRRRRGRGRLRARPRPPTA